MNRIIIATLALAAAMLFTVAHGQDEDAEGLAETPSGDVLWLLFRNLREGNDGNDDGLMAVPSSGDGLGDDGFNAVPSSGGDDHGDTRETATRISLQSVTFGTIDPGNDVDYFRFTVPSTTTVRISTRSGVSGVSLIAVGRLRLYDESGREVARDDGSLGVSGFTITRTLSQGTYYVRVDSSGNLRGTYQLLLGVGRAEEEVDDHGNTRQTATRVAVPSSTRGTIDPGNDVDYFRFTVPSPTTVVIETIHSSLSLDTVGRLYDASGSQVAGNHDSGAGDNFRIWRTLSQGTYYVRVNSNGNRTGGYSLRVHDYDFTTDGNGGGSDGNGGGDDGNGDDDCNSFDCATTIDAHGWHRGRRDKDGDVDWFRFVVNESVILRISAPLVSDIRLYNNVIGMLGAGELSRPIDAGTYYVRLGGLASDYILYTELLPDDHGNTSSNATSMELGVPHTGRIDAIGFSGADADLFRVVVNEPGTLWVSKRGANARVYLYEESAAERLTRANFLLGETYSRSILVNYGGSADGRADTYYVDAGTYIAAVRGGSDVLSDYTYTLQVDFESGVNGDDHAGGHNGATPIDFGVPQTGRIEHVGPNYDVDWFKVDVTEPGTLTAHVTAPDVDTFGTLYDNAGSPIDSSSSTLISEIGNLVTFSDDFTIEHYVDAGTYFVSVRGDSSSDAGDYTFQVDFESVDGGDDHAGGRGGATALEIGVPQRAAFETAGDVDWFRLEVTASGTLTAYTTGIDAVTDVTLYDSAGSILTRRENSAFQYYVDAGTYFVSISGGQETSTGGYGTLRVEFESGDDGRDHAGDRSSAIAMDFCVPQIGTVDQPPVPYSLLDAVRGRDWFRIDVTESSTLTVYTAAPYSELNLDTFGRLYDSFGRQLAANDDGGEGANFVIDHAVDAGAYYVSVEGYGDSFDGRYLMRAEFKSDNGNGSNCNDHDKHGNARDDATEMELGGRQSGMIYPAGDSDWFKVDVTEAGTLTIYATRGWGTVASLYGDCAPDAIKHGNTIEHYVIGPSTYYVRVGGSLAGYNLQVDFEADEDAEDSEGHGDSCTGDHTLHTEFFEPGDATTIALGGEQSGRIEQEGNVDWFRVDVAERGTLIVYTTGSMDTVGRLYNSAGWQLAQQDGGSYSHKEDANFRIEHTIEHPVDGGTYYVAVWGDLDSIGDYTLHTEFEARKPDRDHGGDRGDAIAIAVGDHQSGWIGAADEIDWFRVRVTALGTLTVYTTGSLNTVGRLYDNVGRQLAANDDSGAGTNFRIEKWYDYAGDYYIAVESYGSASGIYNLHTKIEYGNDGDDHGNIRDDATAIEIGASKTGTMYPADDVDWFRFDVTEPGTLTVYTTGSTDTHAELYVADRHLLLASNDDGGEGVNFRVEELVASASTYYIAVRSYDSTTGDYTVHTEFEAGIPDDDHGDDRGDATTMAIGDQQSGWIFPVDDVDWFRIDVTESGTLTIHLARRYSRIYIFGRLYDGAGWQLAVDDDSSLDSRIEHRVAAGTYYVSVERGGGRDTGSYTLHTSFEPDGSDGDDYGDHYSDATSITTIALGGQQSGRIETAGDVDLFRIRVTESGTLTAYTTGGLGTSGELYIWDTQIKSSGGRGEGGNFRIDHRVAAGTYYVSVYSRHTGGYTVHIEFDNGDAPTIAIGGQQSGRIDSAGQSIDWFRIDVTESGKLIVYTSGGNVGTIGQLFDNSGYPVRNPSSGNDGFRIEEYVDAGTYYVSVEGYWNYLSTTGDYTIHVEFEPS